MDIQRLDTLKAGGLLFREIMKVLGARTCSLTEYALRDGIAIHEFGRVHASQKPRRIQPDSEVISEFAKHFEWIQPPPQSGRCIHFFKKYAKFFKIISEWESLFVSFCHLALLGKMFCLENYEKHSAYIASHAEILGLTEHEKISLKFLCEFQNKSHPLKALKEYSCPALIQKNLSRLIIMHQIFQALDPHDHFPLTLKTQGRRLVISGHGAKKFHRRSQEWGDLISNRILFRI
jgi:exopolyphosphatase/pppGpp-phosphohydrolase